MKTIITILALLFTATVWAQDKKSNAFRETDWKIVCSTQDRVVDFLAEYEERPIILGRIGPKGRIAFLINTKTGTWTLLAYTDRGACIIAGGEDAEQIEPRNRD